MVRDPDCSVQCIVCASESTWHHSGRKAIDTRLRNYPNAGNFFVSLGLFPAEFLILEENDVCSRCLSLVITCDNLLSAFSDKVSLVTSWIRNRRIATGGVLESVNQPSSLTPASHDLVAKEHLGVAHLPDSRPWQGNSSKIRDFDEVRGGAAIIDISSVDAGQKGASKSKKKRSRAVGQKLHATNSVDGVRTLARLSPREPSRRTLEAASNGPVEPAEVTIDGMACSLTDFDEAGRRRDAGCDAVDTDPSAPAKVLDSTTSTMPHRRAQGAVEQSSIADSEVPRRKTRAKKRKIDAVAENDDILSASHGEIVREAATKPKRRRRGLSTAANMAETVINDVLDSGPSGSYKLDEATEEVERNATIPRTMTPDDCCSTEWVGTDDDPSAEDLVHEADEDVDSKVDSPPRGESGDEVIYTEDGRMWKPRQRPSRLGKTIIAESGQIGYICEECNIRCPIPDDLYRHYLAHHAIPGGKQCHECGRSFHTSDAYDAHVHDHWLEVKNKVTCIDCRRTVTCKSLPVHISSSHFGGVCRSWTEREKSKRKYWRCPEAPACKYLTVVHTQLRMHLLQAHGDPCGYRCDKCPAKYSEVTALRRHKDVHREEPYKCELCPRTFKVKQYLRCHMRYHADPKWLTCLCPECGVSMTKTNLPVHMARVHGHGEVKVFMCHLCPAKYIEKTPLRRHLVKVHGIGEWRWNWKSHECAECGKTFRDQQALIYHKFAAHGEKSEELKQTSCVYCSKLFYLDNHLRLHLKKVHGVTKRVNGPFHCKLCLSALPERKSFLDHLRVEHDVSAKGTKYKDYIGTGQSQLLTSSD